LQLFSFGRYGLALAALALVVFGAYDSYPSIAAEKRDNEESNSKREIFQISFSSRKSVVFR